MFPPHLAAHLAIPLEFIDTLLPRPAPPAPCRAPSPSPCTSCYRCACSPRCATTSCVPTHSRAALPQDPSPKAFRDLRAPCARPHARAVPGAPPPSPRAAHPPRAVLPLPHPLVLRACRSRCPHRPQPVLAGQAPRLARHHRVSGDQVDDGGRDRHPSAAGRGVPGTGHRRNRLRAKAVAAVAHRHAGAG